MERIDFATPALSWERLTIADRV